MRILRLAVTVAAIALGGKGALAHEFWIDPDAFVVAPGAVVAADLRVGEEFRGNAQAYLTRNFDRFEIRTGGEVRPVEGRLGDIPALSVAGLPEGLAVVVHQTRALPLTWSEWERFLSFAEHKDLGDVTAMQAARGLDQVDVRETYIRYAKSLVAVGEGAGQDARVGLRTELVALTNPYTDDLSGGMAVQLWLDDAVRADAQVELFDEAPDGSVTITLHRTDADGIARLPVTPGHRYMVDAVALEPVEPAAATDPEWRTLWANLTFAVPG
ncbi:DUF4198 domain-containing protein [Roseicyclus persicicus]|uniref:DUF4198 domain-containing protein n=1 Tax=Roseicyclus persicicus TaxID=2650661 RepID=A0A7X6GWZ0_9RHOB|nr:DUF4198 domain-containing protein [Roseibacterium persicicum]NKX43088.1 DUF4198 domain-containing protein [Roseibacterium persicicum]